MAGMTTATTASTNSCRAAATPHARRAPRPTTTSSAAVPARAKSVVREAGTACAVPDATKSGQAAQRPQPGFGARRERRNARAGHRQHRACHHRRHQPGQRRAERRRQRHCQDSPGPTAHQRHHQRQQQAGRGQPGHRDPEHQIWACPGALSTLEHAEITGAQRRKGNPGQRAVTHQQAPMALQQALGDIGIPDRHRGGHQLTAQARVEHKSGQAGRAPSGEPQPRRSSAP